MFALLGKPGYEQRKDDLPPALHPYPSGRRWRPVVFRRKTHKNSTLSLEKF